MSHENDTESQHSTTGAEGSLRKPEVPAIKLSAADQEDSLTLDAQGLKSDAMKHFFSPKLEEELANTSSLRRVRSSGKSFQCTGFDGCNMTFSRSEHLARHVRKHTGLYEPGEKPFACRCGKKFTRLDNLRQHASTIHADEPEANEELFNHLAADMPRSAARAARRQANPLKSVEDATHSGMMSPSVLEGSNQTFYAHASGSLPPPSPYMGSYGGPHSFRPSSPNYHYTNVGAIRSSEIHPSSTYRFPPSADRSFRTESISRQPITPTREHAHQREQHSAHALSPSSSLPPADILSPFNSFNPSHSPAARTSPLQSPVTDGTVSSVSLSDGKGSRFRTESSNLFSPSGITSPRRASGISSASSASAASSVGLGSGHSKPVLPSLSSLIAGHPSLSQLRSRYAENGDPWRQSESVKDVPKVAQLDPSLLVAVELAISASSNRLAIESEDGQTSASSRSLSISSAASSIESLAYTCSSPYSLAMTSPSIASAEDDFRTTYQASRKASMEDRNYFESIKGSHMRLVTSF